MPAWLTLKSGKDENVPTSANQHQHYQHSQESKLGNAIETGINWLRIPKPMFMTT